jgi:hypothetical protein
MKKKKFKKIMQKELDNILHELDLMFESGEPMVGLEHVPQGLIKQLARVPEGHLPTVASLLFALEMGIPYTLNINK